MPNSYFPRWRRVQDDGRGAVVMPDERLSWPQNIAMGAHHVVAMFGSTILAPLLMGFDTNVAILMSGVGTLVFFFSWADAFPVIWAGVPLMHRTRALSPA